MSGLLPDMVPNLTQQLWKFFARGEDFLRVNQSYTRATKDACPMVPAPDCELDTEQVSLFLNC